LIELLEQKVALITGTTSGIGKAFAERFASKGYDLITVARRRERLESQAEMLSSKYNVKVQVLVADIADPKDLTIVSDAIFAESHLSILVNNAGIGKMESFSDMSIENIQYMINLNVTALTSLTHAAIPEMIKRGSGTIINVASGLAFARMPNTAVYAATKAFVTQFTQSLYEDVRNQGIELQALVPGLVRTELGSDGKDSSFFDQFPPEIVMSPETLVEASLAGIELNELICIPGFADYEEWIQADAAIQKVGNSVSSDTPAARYSLKI
jgi:uncharacterized protein